MFSRTPVGLALQGQVDVNTDLLCQFQVVIPSQPRSLTSDQPATLKDWAAVHPA